MVLNAIFGTPNKDAAEAEQAKIDWKYRQNQIDVRTLDAWLPHKRREIEEDYNNNISELIRYKLRIGGKLAKGKEQAFMQLAKTGTGEAGRSRTAGMNATRQYLNVLGKAQAKYDSLNESNALAMRKLFLTRSGQLEAATSRIRHKGAMPGVTYTDDTSRNVLKGLEIGASVMGMDFGGLLGKTESGNADLWTAIFNNEAILPDAGKLNDISQQATEVTNYF